MASAFMTRCFPDRSVPSGGVGGAVVRPAGTADLPALMRLETSAFSENRLSRRSLHHLLTRAHAFCLVAELRGTIVGYALVLLRRGTSLARLYSFAVNPERRGEGLGRTLLRAAEREAAGHHAQVMRLEVRPDNAAAIALYRAAGYRQFGRYMDYYEDHAAALRFEKRLALDLSPREPRVPYYGQTTDFTCGPAALLMAMKALDPAVELDRRQELRLWREATTVFMASGHGGCEPFGMALAAHRRGFRVVIHVSEDSPIFLDGVRDPRKKEVMRLVQMDFRDQVAETDITVVHRSLTPDELAGYIDEGAIPIVLISLFRMYRVKEPHWVVVHGHDDRFIYAHDPLIERDTLDEAMDKADMPIPLREFAHMSRYGRTALRAAVVLSRREAP